MSKYLIKFDNSIFSKIYNFIYNVFKKNKPNDVTNYENKSKGNFIEEINAKQNLEFKYNELLKKFKILGSDILEKNNIEFDCDDFLNQIWYKVIIIYPEKRNEIIKSIQMIYNDEILTEYNFNKLEEIYNEFVANM